MSAASDFFSASDGSDRWMREASCASPEQEPEDWFPDYEQGRNQPGIRNALALCKVCPVKEPCLAYAMASIGTPNRVTGVWGGTTGHQRQRRAGVKGRTR